MENNPNVNNNKNKDSELKANAVKHKKSVASSELSDSLNNF